MLIVLLEQTRRYNSPQQKGRKEHNETIVFIPKYRHYIDDCRAYMSNFPRPH